MFSVGGPSGAGLGNCSMVLKSTIQIKCIISITII